MVCRDEKGRFEKGNGVKDISGTRYGKLVAIKLDHIANNRTYWLCKCDCGNEKVIRSDSLNRIQSCGCVKREQDKINLHIKNNHGMTHHPAFNIWLGMIARCTHPNVDAYKDYGGRGITICPEWMDAKIFCKWMDENNYQKGLSIERVNVNGNYEPDNCILIPLNEQTYNRRNTIYIETDVGVFAMALEAKRNNVPRKTVLNRYKRGERSYERLFHKGRLE